jgi:hypothetical protein
MYIFNTIYLNHFHFIIVNITGISSVHLILQELAAGKAEAEISQKGEEYGIKPEVAITEETERIKNRFLEDEFEGENFE